MNQEYFSEPNIDETELQLIIRKAIQKALQMLELKKQRRSSTLHFRNSTQIQQNQSSTRKKEISYANLSQIALNDQIDLTDIILSIIEVAINKDLYTSKNANTTSSFWLSILNNKEINIIFEAYKEETLRKYWMMIKQCSINTFVSTVQKNKTIIDSMHKFKLKTIIRLLANYVLNHTEQESFEAFYSKQKRKPKSEIEKE